MAKAATAQAGNSTAGESTVEKPNVGKSGAAKSAVGTPGAEQAGTRKKRKHKRSWTPEPGELERLDRARAVVAQMREAVKTLGQELSREMFGEQGPEWGTKFGDLEVLGRVLGQAMTTSFLETALGDQSHQSVPETHECCPACQARGAPAEAEPRLQRTPTGDVHWQEPQRTCEHCRKSFFPSEPRFGDRPERTQPGVPAGADRLGNQRAVVRGSQPCRLEDAAD